MNDEILQHHFDEVFNALQDRENFEIFTKLKYVQSPKVKQIFFKIVSPSQVNSITSFQDNNVRRVSQTLRSNRPATVSTTARAKAIFRPANQKSFSGPLHKLVNSSSPSPRSYCRDSMSSRPLSPRPITPGSIASNSRQTSENYNNLLDECPYCGRYFLGDYLRIHEEKCEQENFHC
ncbi:hypothetical protein ABEB36_008705 [Hypothenemus hampei]|uniref:Uncharacterized protein n=1 Tax=Hypothenemus hampei TaxID=57062 RepID=A0ABD1EMU2_HYPHA